MNAIATEELDSLATALARIGDGIRDDVTLFLAVTRHTTTPNPHILHGLKADLDRIERHARALRFILTELEGE